MNYDKGARVVTVTIDTEEDNWGSFAALGATVRNIDHLPAIQEIFDRWSARPTYLVNQAPVAAASSVAVLGALAQRADVEIGGHCHPWNTPPLTAGGVAESMMCNLSYDANHAKIGNVTCLIEAELGVHPTTFRAGRWGFGPTIAKALREHGYRVDCSVTPFVDWSPDGGPDYSEVPSRPYRFQVDAPFKPDPHGPMVEIPATVGFVGRFPSTQAALHTHLRKGSVLGRKFAALLKHADLLRQHWLSPEKASLHNMLRLADSLVAAGQPVLSITFHSCTLLPGATPYVRDERDRTRFLHRLDAILQHCTSLGFRFSTMAELGKSIMAGSDPAAGPA
jgi:hypothetical protein